MCIKKWIRVIEDIEENNVIEYLHDSVPQQNKHSSYDTKKKKGNEQSL